VCARACGVWREQAAMRRGVSRGGRGGRFLWKVINGALFANEMESQDGEDDEEDRHPPVLTGHASSLLPY